jgi:hypothetical protein
MKTRRRQRGSGYIAGTVLAVLTVLNLLDLVLTFRRTILRRTISSSTGRDSVEPSGVYFKRIGRTFGRPILLLATLAFLFWAIVHFGPLKPVHEWFQ